MKHALQLTPSLNMTPLLSQAIRLLQLSSMELQQEIQHQLDSNPLLEEEEESEFQWISTQHPQGTADTLLSTSDDLQTHLRWQLDLTPMSETDHAIGMVIIDALDEDGFLTPEDLLDTLPNVNHAEIEAVRHLIQHFEPLGCAAYTLAETLCVQLGQWPVAFEPARLAKVILTHHLPLLCKHDYPKLMAVLHIDEPLLENILNLIQHQHPRPGQLMLQDSSEQVVPDFYVKKTRAGWQVFENPTTLHHLGINKTYLSWLDTSRGRDRRYLKQHLNEAHWFIKSLRHRQETILKITRFIVDYQKSFLDFGEGAMKPLILNDVAQALDMHESTISRATTQKFISTPRGLFELKAFFSNHLRTIFGEGCSSTAICAFIKKLITAEDPTQPLSDQQIKASINKEGINIARRTVTKYRQSMCIAPSVERQSIHNKPSRPFGKNVDKI